MKIKKMVFTLLAAFIICGCTRQQQNDLTLQEVKGNVKSVRTTIYEATEKFGEISEGNVLFGNNLIYFNKDGFITEISYFDNRGVLTGKSIYVFDDDGKVSKINHFNGDGDETGRTIYTYNEARRVIKIVDYDKAGKINYTQKNEWENDKCVKSQYLDDYSKGDYIINEFRGQNLIKSVVYDKNGNKTGEYTEYENDKMTKIVKSDYTMSITYNDKGLCTTITNGQLSGSNSFLLINGESYLYEYEYDEKDNWIRKVEKEKKSQKAKRIFVREIEYY